MFKILLSGLYGINNLGDDYICWSMVNNLIKRVDQDIQISVVSNRYDCAWLKKEYPQVRIAIMKNGKYKRALGMFNEIYKSNCLILGGGGLWTSESIKQIILQLLFFFVAKLSGCKIIFFGVEINSLNKKWYQLFWKFFVNHSEIFIARNHSTISMLCKIKGIDHKKLFGFVDTTFAFSTKDEKKSQNAVLQNFPGDFVLWALAMPWTKEELKMQHFKKRYDNFLDQIVQLALKMSDKYRTQIFMPFYEGSDIVLIRDVIGRIGDRCKCIIADGPDYPIGCKRIMFKYAKYVIAMRFHSVLFALYHATPFTAISYSNKTSTIMDEMGLDNQYVEIGIRDNQFFYREFDLDEELLYQKIQMSHSLHMDEKNKELLKHSKKCKEEADKAFCILASVLNKMIS